MAKRPTIADVISLSTGYQHMILIFISSLLIGLFYGYTSINKASEQYDLTTQQMKNAQLLKQIEQLTTHTQLLKKNIANYASTINDHPFDQETLYLFLSTFPVQIEKSSLNKTENKAEYDSIVEITFSCPFSLLTTFVQQLTTIKQYYQFDQLYIRPHSSSTLSITLILRLYNYDNALFSTN